MIALSGVPQLVAHVRKELRFGEICRLCGGFRFAEVALRVHFFGDVADRGDLKYRGTGLVADQLAFAMNMPDGAVGAYDAELGRLRICD